MHERTGLVGFRLGEGDAEFHRRQRKTALDEAAIGVEFGDRLAAAGIVGALFQFGDDALDDAVLDLLVIGGQVALAVHAHGVVKIQLANFERVLADGKGHLIDDALRTHHALRTAETAKRGVRHRVGVQERRFGVHMRVEIGVVAVEEGTVAHRAGEISRETGPEREGIVDAEDAALVVEADIVIDGEIVPLAGRNHILVAVEPHLDCAVELLGSNSRKRRKLVRLCLLATEPATHTAYFHRDRVARRAERVRDHVLCLARPLGRAIDQNLVVLAGHGQRNLALEIEMVLPAEPHAALHPARCAFEGSRRIATLQRQRREDLRMGFLVEVPDVDIGRQFLIFDFCQPRRTAGLLAGFRNHAKNRLAVELDLAFCQHRIVMHAGRRDVVDAGNVFVGQHVDDAGG